MVFDKQVAHVGYNDAQHIYVNTKNQQRYTSVTTLIHKFIPPFKAKYWSIYKGVKDVIESKDPDMWRNYKRQAGGWEKVVDFYNRTKHQNQSLQAAVEKRAKYYINLWDAGREHACALGTAIHEELENAAHTAQHLRNTSINNKINYEVSQENILELQDFSSNRLYPELLVYSDEFMVAGQVDGVFKSGNKVDIFDYKTCKSIDTEPFRGETLLAPFTNISNANYYIYQLQMSVYGLMLELNGYEVGSLELHWIYGDDPESDVRDKVKTFKIDYIPITARKMLEQNIF